MLHGVFHGKLPQHNGAAVPGATRAASPKIRGQDWCRGGCSAQSWVSSSPLGSGHTRSPGWTGDCHLRVAGSSPKLAAEGARGAAPPGRHAAPLS